MSIGAALYSSEHQDWNTPECVLERVRFVGPIALDPCSNAQSIVRARIEYRLERGEDGLKLPWDVGGLIFLNPPYDDEIAAFMRRANTCGQEVIALVPHRTDTAWYHENISNLAAKCEWRGRLKHMRGVADQRQRDMFGIAPVAAEEGDAPAPFPSVVLYWGRRVVNFTAAFAGAGAIWTR